MFKKFIKENYLLIIILIICSLFAYLSMNEGLLLIDLGSMVNLGLIYTTGFIAFALAIVLVVRIVRYIIRNK